MTKILKILVIISAFGALIVALTYGATRGSVDVLSPAGQIAQQQRDLIVFAAVLSMVVIIPVFAMLFGFAAYYRAGNKRARYEPNWAHNKYIELTWLAIPLFLIGILAVITWRTSHSLDPFKPLANDEQPVNVQVIALEWKWLFIYPEYGIASLNYLEIPEQTPINFSITSDAPMNSLWIPRLGGQIYAMAGMNSKLHLIAEETGTYQGRSANISGEGFAGMTFDVRSSTLKNFDEWIRTARESGNILDGSTYNILSEKSIDEPPQIYQLAKQDLYASVLEKYNVPPPELQEYNDGKMGH